MRDRNAAAKLLMNHGWTFEEVEAVLASKKTAPIGKIPRQPTIKSYGPPTSVPRFPNPLVPDISYEDPQ